MKSKTSNMVLLEKVGRVGYVRMSRGDKLNALNFELRREIEDSHKDLSEDDAVRVAVLTGTDKVFSAGWDINEFKGMGPLEVRKTH